MFLVGGKVRLDGFHAFLPKHLRNVINGNSVGNHRGSQSVAQIMELLACGQSGRHAASLIDLSGATADANGVYGAFARRNIRFVSDAGRPLRT